MTEQTVTSLTVRDYKGVKGEVTLHPDGKSLILIAGPNGAGKSSFIDAIAEIFDPKGVRLTAKPIHEGAKEARAEVVTSEVRLVRTWTKEDAGTLAAYALDGAKYASGKELVVKATGGALFDSSAFINMDAKEQRAALLKRVSLPFDLATVDRERAGLFEQRRDTGRVVDQLAGQLAGMPEPVDGLPEAEQSAADIIAEFEKARQFNDDLDKKYRAATDAEGVAEEADLEVARLADALDAARTYAERAHEAAASLVAEVKSGPERIDTDTISAKLATIEDTNAKVRATAERAKVAAALAAKREEQAQFTLALEAIDTKKVDALATAVFPDPRLSVDDDGITVDGIPFKQANTATKIGIAFNLATSDKPDLRIVVIKDGDSLDSVSLADIQKQAEERKYLVLMERDRDESREIASAVFTDGEVAA
jgi:ABC-type branched-subunit amino acid transport system ATPase component